MKLKLLLILITLSSVSFAKINKTLFQGTNTNDINTSKTVSYTLAGSVISDNQKMITSRYMGFIKIMSVSEGDLVKKGDPLYEIDSKEIEAAERQVDLAISQARIALQMNKNQHNNIILNLGRQKRLLQKNMVSKYEFETIQLAEKNLQEMIKISEKQVQQAEAKKDEVLNQYRYLKIIAPNDGVIVQKRLNQGEMAIPGSPALVLTDLTDLKVTSEVSEHQLKNIYIGQKMTLKIPSIAYESIGIVESIIPASNPMTHKFKIKMSLEKKSNSVYPGMYVTIKYKIKHP